MSSPIGPNEIRVVIQPVEARDYDLVPIPAQLFKKTFDAFFTALASDRPRTAAQGEIERVRHLAAGAQFL